MPARVGPVAPDREPVLQVALACTDCQQTFIPSDDALSTGRAGCPGCGGWVFWAELVPPQRAGSC